MALVALAYMAASSTDVLAQSTTNNQPKDTSTIHRDFQISFVPMLGTNGMQSPYTVNRVSFNIIAGISKEVGAAEYGGVANITKGNVTGFQYAGVLNTSKRVTGCQVAGVANLGTGNVKGFQAAGVINTAKEVTGFQAAGVANIANGKVVGYQAAGVVNIAKNVDGVQLAGIYNQSDSMVKSQFAGIANLAKDVQGVQVAGIFNSATTVKGVQISGLVNRAKSAGTQIGFINIADSCSGAPIGIINIIKTGYHQIEFSGDELFYTNLAYRSGVKRLHSIVSVGIRPDYHHDIIWTNSFGLGTSQNLSPKTLLDADISYGHVIVNDKCSMNNQLFRAFVGIDRCLTKKMSISVGVTANALVYSTSDAQNSFLMNQIVPYTIISEKINDHKSLAGWIGGKVALRFN